MRATNAKPWARWGRAGVLLAVLLSMTAYAQAPANVLVACKSSVNCPDGAGNSPYDDSGPGETLQDAIDDGVVLARNLGEQVLLLVVGGPWQGPFEVPADANLHILGVALNTQQKISIFNPEATVTPTTGEYTLSFTDPRNDTTDTTAGIDHAATAAEVQAALEALTTIGVGNVLVTGATPEYTVQFQGVFAGLFVPLLVSAETTLAPPEAFVVVESNEGPFTVILQGATGSDVLRINGAATDFRDEGFERERLIVEGVSMQGGDAGVRVSGGDTTTFPGAESIEPTLDRIYVIENGVGVVVEGMANPLLVNSSISINTSDGLQVAGAPADATTADVLHCAFIDNGDNGIFVADGNTARIRNTLVFENGTGSGEGGIVWENNPFIDPDEGPLDGLDPGTGNPIVVTITGSADSNFLQGGPAEVFFGPPSKAGTAGNVTNTTATTITVDLPPSAFGVPGPVDVYIRRADGFEVRVPNGFLYTGETFGADPVPIVTQVDPGWGPANEPGYDVFVYGFQFERDCSVFFDADRDGFPDGAEQSPRVQWISAGKLYVRVPPHAATPLRFDVLVRNNTTGQISPANVTNPALDPVLDFEYRTEANPPPRLTSIVPDRITTTGGTGNSTSPALLPDALGANFLPGAVIKIGDVVCTYVLLETGGGAIRDITVPVSEFGAGGVYDVEVINPDGQSDVLPNAFTYFPSGEPEQDSFPEDEWRESNFVERGAGGARDYYGHGFDNNVQVREAATDTVIGTFTPVAQRLIAAIPFPADTAPLTGANGAINIDLEIINTATELGNTSSTVFATPRMHYAENRATAPAGGQATYFEIQGVSVTPGTPDQITLTVLNADSQMTVFVGDLPAVAPVITPGGLGATGTIVFDAPTVDDGQFGPVDVRVELGPGQGINLTADTLYFVAEDAYTARRTQDPPRVDTVTPATVADDGTVPVRVTGSNFIAPIDVTATADQLLTRLVLTWNNGNSVVIAPGAPGVTDYEVVSYTEITFTLNLDTVPFVLVDNLTDFPRGEAVDVRAEQVQGAAVLTDTNGVNLAHTLTDALTFVDGTGMTITTVTPNEGPVAGHNPLNPAPDDTLIQIIGTGFNVAGGTPRVLVGTSEAVVVGVLTDTEINFELPPAPDGKPGIYDVTVIRAADTQQVTALNAFTYYMDGAPILEQISPNHTEFDPAAPPATPVTLFVTLRGYNFDDEVRITFTDILPSVEFFSLATNDPATAEFINVISPNEIQIEISTDDLNGVLQAGDYTGGFATLNVTVQNQPINVPPAASAISLTSNPLPFFAFNDARGIVEVEMPELLYNDVYRNNQDDYLNISPGPGSISVNPLLTITPWLGKLDDGSPLLNTAGDFTASPFTVNDFEIDARPQDSGPEIGADEILTNTLETCSWYNASVLPNPVGRAASGDLRIIIQYSGNCGGNPFVVPQGGDPAQVNDRIPLRLVTSLGNGSYLYTNDELIETVLDNRVGNENPQAGDLIADGHAVIYLLKGSEIIGYIPGNPTSSLTYTVGGFPQITGEAVDGRHFLIDTVPPRMFIESVAYGGLGYNNIVSAKNIIISHNDTITASNFDGPTHPQGAPPGPPTALGFGQPVYTPTIDVMPVDDRLDGYGGGIVFKGLNATNEVPGGTQAFFNRGSVSNPDSPTVFDPATLTASFQVIYIDPPVTDPDDVLQIPIPALDFYTNSTWRQVAGFPINPEALTEGAGGDVDTNILLSGVERPAFWVFDPALTNGLAKTATYTTSDNPATVNEGVFDPSIGLSGGVSSPGVAVEQSNDVLQADWEVIDMAQVANRDFHISTRFAGEDLAVNQTGQGGTDYPTLFDPLQFWWMYYVASGLQPSVDNTAVSRPEFDATIISVPRPSPRIGPVPAFSYRLWTSDAYDGVYTVTSMNWTTYTSDPHIDLMTEVTGTVLGEIVNRWVLIVVLAADEAGNVEPWPLGVVGNDNGPIDLTDPATSDYVRALPGWQRFLFTNLEAPDTRVQASFWHDLDDDGVIDSGEPFFGSNPIIPMVAPTSAAKVRAQFLLSHVRPPGVTGDIEIEWSLFQDDTAANIGNGTTGILADNDVFTVTITAPPGVSLGDFTRPITYVFTARAGYGTPPILDPSPENVYFTVVPAGVGDYMDSPTDENKQPIKEQGVE